MARWRNWEGDQRCRPAVLARPRTVTDVVDAVRAARGTVRVAGSGHSFGDLVPTDGTLLDLRGLAGLRAVDVAAGLVRVGAGTRLRALNELLAGHGLALPNLGDVDVQTVAGALATGTHGTGARLGNLATGVVGLELVTADRSVLRCTGETLRAARISLGALGVVTEVTLRVVPAFRLRGEDRPVPLPEVLARLDELVDGNDHFEFHLFPHTDVALTRANNRTAEPARPARLRYLDEVLLQNRALDVVCRAGRAAPAAIPRLNRLAAAAARKSTRVARSDRVLTSRRTVRFTETEWALPRAAARDALRDLHALGARHEVTLPVEVRFVAGDEESFLSPAWGRDTVYLAAHAYRGTAWEGYFRGVQDIALAHDGRPHWGKRHGLGAVALADRYPAWERFRAVRARLDPGGRFANPHVRRVLGVEGARPCASTS